VSVFSAAISARILLSYPLHKSAYYLLVCLVEPAGLGWRRGDAGLLLGVFDHVEQHLGRAQIGRSRFVDQLMDNRFALGDLAPLPVDRDENRLVQRIGEQCRQVLFAAAAGVAGLPLAEAGVQRRPAGTHLVIVLVLRHMRLPIL